MRRQAIPVAGITSDLEVAMERCYNEHILDTATPQKKKGLHEKLGSKPGLAPKSSKPTGTGNLGRGETIKIHQKKKAPGQDWTPVPPKDDGPDVGKCYEPPRCQENMGTGQASQSPLTEELLALGESVTMVLDQFEDPEIAQAISNILLSMDTADVEIEEVASGFQPEVGCMGYDVDLVRHSDDTRPGSASPVTAQENQLLDEGTHLIRAPGTGRPGAEEDSSWPITNKKA